MSRLPYCQTHYLSGRRSQGGPHPTPEHIDSILLVLQGTLKRLNGNCTSLFLHCSRPLLKLFWTIWTLSSLGRRFIWSLLQSYLESMPQPVYIPMVRYWLSQYPKTHYRGSESSFTSHYYISFVEVKYYFLVANETTSRDTILSTPWYKHYHTH